MVYHTNEATATIEGGVSDNDLTGQKLEQIYTIYKSGNGKAKVSVNNKPIAELTQTDKVPKLKDYSFKSWNNEKAKGKVKYDIHKIEDVYDFTKDNFTKGTEAEITSIINPDTLNTYAVYDKMMVVKAMKVWNANNKADTTLQLIRTDKPGEIVE